MRIIVFDAKKYDEVSLNKANNEKHEIKFVKEDLSSNNIEMVQGFDAVSGFVNTEGNSNVMEKLSKLGIKYWLQRSKGYNRIDLEAAKNNNIKVFRVPNYSSESVADQALTLLLAVNRNLKMSIERTSEWNFDIEGLEARSISESTIGVIGAGLIGQTFIKYAIGLGAKVLVHDDFVKKNNPDLSNLGFEWSDLDNLFSQSDFISLHVPLLPSTKHLINKEAISKMKKNIVIINTSRGEVVDTVEIVKGLNNGKIRGFGADVLERESGRFFCNRTNDKDELITEDTVWCQLLMHERAIITPHQAFLTDVAVSQIAETTIKNATDAEKGNFENSLEIINGKVKNG